METRKLPGGEHALARFNFVAEKEVKIPQ